MLKINKMSHDWGRFQLKNVDLEIKDNEFLVILGPSGAGKTLLLETIAGFTVPDEGEIIYNKDHITKKPPEKRDIGFVYQDFGLFPHLSVKENIGFGIREMKKEKKEKEVTDLASFLGIQELLEEDPLTLSGGEKQRVTLARALATEPSLMLFDEPLSSLDERIQKRMRREIKEIHKKKDLTSVYVTHDQSEAMFLADRVAIMIDGSIIQVGEPKDVFYSPKNDEVAQFVGVENIYNGYIKNKNESLVQISVSENEIEALSDLELGKKVKVMVRPEEVILKKSMENTSARNSYEGEITEIIDEGSVIRVKIKCGFDLISYITRKSFKELDLSIGDKVVGSFKANSVHVI